MNTNPNDGSRFVLDTKWKDVAGVGPSPSDLQQLFAYSQFFSSARNALVYPGQKFNILSGCYAISTEWAKKISCSLIQLGLISDIKKWQEAIYNYICTWMQNS